MRRAGPGKILMYICLHNAENRRKSEEPLDKVPVPSWRGHQCHCSLLTWITQNHAVSTDTFTVSLTMTNFISLFNFPPYSWPDPSLASSLLFSVMRAYHTHLLPDLLLLLTSLQSPLIFYSAKALSSLSSLPVQLMDEHSGLWFFLIPGNLFSVFFTWPKLLSSKWLTEFFLQHYWQPLE